MGVEVRGGNREGKERQAFMKRLLRDVRALEQMIDTGMIETGVRRIGAEQELFLVDSAYRATPSAEDVLARIEDPLYEHELALYNLEFSVDPVSFGGKCLSQMENQLLELLAKGRAAAEQVGTKLAMVGILPTIEKSDVGLHNVTPNPRYKLLNDTLGELRGDSYEINIRGADEVVVKHDSVMLESANTSFQVHFQVGPEEFAKLYNIAQTVCAPVLAAATNSPLLFGKRLWRETRIALFQQSVDTRPSGHHMRELKPRVSFGGSWINDSILEIFREDIARFRVLFAADVDEFDPLDELARGDVPSLSALRLHNSTVYRWNRPCYGVNPDGTPHLRIENRVLPSGPTPIDEMANAAFWFGLMSGVIEEYGDITQHMDFDDARGNLFAAARNGLAGQMTWVDGSSCSASELILDKLLPLAKQGLVESKIDQDDIERYLDTIEHRVRKQLTGADWQLRSYSRIKNTRSQSEALSTLTAATIRLQETNTPVHEWPLVDAHQDKTSWKNNHERVSQYMSRDLFTLNQDEPIEFAASLMTWHHIHWIPVEDHEHNLVGLITHELLLELFANGSKEELSDMLVSSVMKTDVPAIAPSTRTLKALEMMYEQKLSCIPVVDNGKLVGMVTERNIMGIARQLLEEKLGESD